MENPKPKRDFSTLVRMPYQDAIALILRTMDYHSLMAIQSTDKYYKEFHKKQHERLMNWMVDMKDYIIELEKELDV